MRLRIDIQQLRRNAKLLGSFGSGRGYFNDKCAYGKFEAIADGVRLSLQTPIGGICMEMDAEVEETGVLGMDLLALANFLKTYRSGWWVDFETDLCDRTDERAVLKATFGNDSDGTRHRQEWSINTDVRGGLLFDSEWVPDLPSQEGVLLEGQITISRLKELVLPALAGYKEDLSNMAALQNAAALVLGSDQLGAYAGNGTGGVHATAWADETMDLGLEWEHPSTTVWLHGESLRRAVQALGAVQGLKAVQLLIPEKGDQPIRLAAADDPECFQIFVPRAESPGLPMPELITQAVRSEERAVSSVPTHHGFSPWPLEKALETLKAYQSHDVSNGVRDVCPLLLEFHPDHLVLEVISDLMVGAKVDWPWSASPSGELMKGKRLPLVGLKAPLFVLYLSAVLSPVARDQQADIEVILAIDDNGQERVLLRSEGETGVRITALVCTYSTSGRRLGDALPPAEGSEVRELVEAG